MKLNLNWKILFASLTIMGVLATSLGYIVGVSSVTMTTGIQVWNVKRVSEVHTSSTSYVLVPGMKLTIDAPVGAKLVITFSTYCYIGVGASVFVKLLVDNSGVSPKDVIFNSNGVGGTREYTWVKHVTAGTHTIKLKWKVDSSGCTIVWSSLVVFANSYKEFT